MHVSLAPLVPVADAALSEADIALLVAALGTVTGVAAVEEPAGTSLLTPASGAFNAAMAAKLSAWSEG